VSLVLGIDLGTQGLKVLFYDPARRRVEAVGSAPLQLDQRAGGVAEQRVEWWVQALEAALRQVTAGIRNRVRAIGVSGQQHGFVPLDAAGQVLAPVKLWCDTSTQEDCEAITQTVGGTNACIAAAGNPVLPGYTASKLHWFRRVHPDLYARLRWVLLPHDFLNFYLTGERWMEAGDASGTAFFDIRRRDWSEPMLRAIDPDRDLRDCLPPLHRDNVAAGTLRHALAESLGLPAGIPVSVGGGDNMMGAIGTGNVVPRRVTMSLGTSGTVYAYSAAPVVDPQGEIAAFCASTGGWLPLLCTMNSTIASELVRQLLGADRVRFEAQLAEAPPGADGIITVPFFTGERTPSLPHGKGCVVGLDSRNMQAGNLLRSAVEGATYSLRFGLDRLGTLGIQSREIILTGGGARSAAWRQIVADVCNLPVRVPVHEEGAAFGAALQALALVDERAAGRVEALAAEHVALDEARNCEPRPAAADFYAEAYDDYRRAVGAIVGLYS
jgi:xylulokinase